jgi:hypothetical protein
LNGAFGQEGVGVRLVVVKKAGEPGKVAINPALVTHLRSGPGNFVDVFFGDVKVAVEGSFEELSNRLSGEDVARKTNDPARDWYSSVRT